MLILVIDDETSIRNVVAVNLKSIFPKAVITKAANAIEAESAMRTLKYDLIISDLQMPRKSGVELFEELMPELQKKFILMTGSGNEGIQEGKNAGIQHFLEKPFRIPQLEETLKKLGHLR